MLYVKILPSNRNLCSMLHIGRQSRGRDPVQFITNKKDTRILSLYMCGYLLSTHYYDLFIGSIMCSCHQEPDAELLWWSAEWMNTILLFKCGGLLTYVPAPEPPTDWPLPFISTLHTQMTSWKPTRKHNSHKTYFFNRPQNQGQLQL